MSPRHWAWAGSVVLAAGALLHASGFTQVSEAAAASGLSAHLAGAFRGLWLYASSHWLVLAALAAVAVRLSPPASRVVLGFVAAILTADVVLMLTFVGPMAVELIPALAAVAYAVAALGRR